MEHEKKKRQKKKKNKQGKTNQSVSAESNNDVNVAKRNLNSESSDVDYKDLQQKVLDSDRESINGAESSRSVEPDKSYWLNREASLEQKMKELQDQLESQSQKERNKWHQKEAELETRILQLQVEKDLWVQKEAGYEEKMKQLVEEKTTMGSIRVSFEEKLTQMEEEKVNLAQKEKSAAETIDSLNKDNARLRLQVVELEASGNNVSQENQQLKEHVSHLHSKIQDLERSMHVAENDNMNSQLESAQALIEKLLSENEKLVHKVNILKAEVDQKRVKTDSSLIVKKSESDENSDTVSNVGPSNEEGMQSDKIMESYKNKEARLKSKNMNEMNSEDLNEISGVSMESGEIVQISLDENEVAVPKSTTSVPDSVPLTDAPLIGAPFRLISFVARYVSGADLVQT